MIIALRLPPKADSEPPEILPRIFMLPSRDSVKVLSGRLIVAVLTNSAILRAIYGFLTLFLAFSIRSNDLTTSLLGMHLSQTKALAYAIGALGVGTFVATAIGSRMKIHRPTLMQAGGIVFVALTALVAAAAYNLGTVIILCLTTAIVSGLAKLAVDASIQEQIPEQVRASAFAHSETLLMLAFVGGGAIGLIPFPGRVGIGIAAAGIILAAIRAGLLAVRLRNDKLVGSAHGSGSTVEFVRSAEAATEQRAVSDDDQRRSIPANYAAAGGAAQQTAAQQTAVQPGQSQAQLTLPHGPAPTRVEPGPAARAGAPVTSEPPKKSRWRRRSSPPEVPSPSPAPTPTQVLPRGDVDQPGFHLYRPSPSDAPKDGG